MTGQNEDIDTIKQLIAAWHAGWLASDTEALLDLYMEDAVLLPQNRPVVVGKDAIRALYESFFAQFTVKGDGRLIEAEVAGDWGYFWITYRLQATPKAGGEAIEDQGKSIFILKRQHDGAWKITRLMDNSDRAPDR